RRLGQVSPAIAASRTTASVPATTRPSIWRRVGMTSECTGEPPSAGGRNGVPAGQEAEKPRTPTGAPGSSSTSREGGCTWSSTPSFGGFSRFEKVLAGKAEDPDGGAGVLTTSREGGCTWSFDALDRRVRPVPKKLSRTERGPDQSSHVGRSGSPGLRKDMTWK